MPNAPSVNPHEQAARSAKVARIIAVLPRGSEAVAALEGAGDEAWRFVARRAGVRTPSPTTRAQVLDVLRRVHQ